MVVLGAAGQPLPLLLTHMLLLHLHCGLCCQCIHGSRKLPAQLCCYRPQLSLVLLQLSQGCCPAVLQELQEGPVRPHETTATATAADAFSTTPFAVTAAAAWGLSGCVCPAFSRCR